MKILVVIDCQNDFIDDALRNEEAIKAVPHIVEKINNWDGELIYTLDTHFEDYMGTREGRYLPVQHCIITTDGWRLNKDIAKAIDNNFGDDCYEVQKNTFGSIDLLRRTIADIGTQKEYKYNTENEIQFVGFCTDICVVSNALITKAAFPEIKVSVDASCCAGVTPEKHQAALEVMKSCQIEVIGE